MIRNISLHFGVSPRDGSEWIKRTSRTSDREYDIIPPVEEITIRLDAHDLEALTINETDGIIIISHIKDGAEREVVYIAQVLQP